MQDSRRAQAVLQISYALTHRVQQTRRLQGRMGPSIAGFVDQCNTVHINSIVIYPRKIKGCRLAALKPVKSAPMLFRTFAGLHGLLFRDKCV